MAPKLLKSFLVLALVLSGFAFAATRLQVEAAALSNISDLISDSRPSTVANHTVTYTTPSIIADTETITITFPAGFSLTGIDEDDVDVKDDAVELTTAANCAGTEHAGVGVSGQVITITICSDYNGGAGIAATSVVEVQIGLHATSSGTGNSQITNHATPGVYTIAVAGTQGTGAGGANSGDALIAVIATITASVTIDETLSVTVTGDDTETCPTVANSDATASTTATSIPFGTTTGNAFIDGCQAIAVSTNAANGYAATIIMNDQLSFGTTEIANGNCDGGCSTTVDAAWATDTNNGLGYCLQNETGTDMDSDFTGNDCNDATPNFKLIPDQEAAGTPEPIMSNAGAVSGSSVYISYRLSVPGDQAAGTYTNNMIYVVTPTY